MALNVEVGTKVLDLTTGVKTYALPAGFDPKALIVYTTHQTADGLATTHGLLGYGFATTLNAINGKTAAYLTQLIDPSNTASRIVTWSDIRDQAACPLLQVGVTVDSVTVDWVINFDGFGAAEWRIDVTNAPGTTGIRLHYIVLGGSDIEDVAIGSHVISAATGVQEVACPPGFGQPDLVHFLSLNSASSPPIVATTQHFHQMFGWAVSETERRCVVMGDQDAAGTMVTASWQKDRAGLGLTSAGAADWEFDLGPRAGWPTDGFDIDVIDAPAADRRVYFLALRGSFNKKIGSNLTPTTNVAVDSDAGFVPKLGYVWGHVMPSGTGIQRAAQNADATALSIGAYDAAAENSVCVSQDDGKTTSFGRKRSTTAKAYTTHEAVAGAVRAEADGSFSGNNLRLTFTTSHATQRQFSWLALGDGAGAIEQAIGAGTETDTAQPVARQKTRAVGAPTTTETAGAIGRVKMRALGAAVETSAGQAVARSKARAVGLASETDTAGAITTPQPLVAILGAASETDAAQPVARTKLRAVSAPAELDEAAPLGRTRSRALGTAAETESAGTVGRRKERTAGAATETSLAGALGRLRSRVLGAAQQADVAGDLGSTKSKAIAASVETDTAGSIVRQRSRVLGGAAETDAGGALGRVKTLGVVTASEIEAAGSLARQKLSQLVGAIEADIASTLTRLKRKALGAAAETDSPGTIVNDDTQIVVLGPASETDAASALGRRKERGLSPASETDAAELLGRSKTRTVGAASETSVATPVGRRKERVVGLAVEFDESGALGRTKRATLGPALEVDEAGAIVGGAPYISVGTPMLVGVLRRNAPTGRGLRRIDDGSGSLAPSTPTSGGLRRVRPTSGSIIRTVPTRGGFG